MDNCLFCKIVEGQIPAQLVYQDSECVAFRDINPQAPTHILVIPRRHIPTTNDLQPDDQALVGHLTLAAARIARQEGIEEDGYRLIMNCNEGAGQSVFHIHLHLLGGRGFGWPPG
jgi:histidine triad (HIT) family protein